MERLPKGHRVICAFSTTSQKYFIESLVKEFGLTFKESDDLSLLECFVSGDTEEHGLSIVALDNPLCCMYHHKDPSQADRKKFSNGYQDYWVLEPLQVSSFTPICPY